MYFDEKYIGTHRTLKIRKHPTLKKNNKKKLDFFWKTHHKTKKII